MKTQSTTVIFSTLVFLVGNAFCGSGYASSLTIDDFSHSQYLADQGDSAGAASNSESGLTGTQLQNVTRTFNAEATVGGASSEIEIASGVYSPEAGGYLLNISNSPHSSGTASIVWSFKPINFMAYGSSILLDVFHIDLDVSVEMIANEIASSGIKTFSNSDDFLVAFNDFSNSEVFSNVSSFRLNFTGPQAWDGQFKLLTTGAPVATVPVPPSLFLMGAGLLGLVGITRKKPSA